MPTSKLAIIRADASTTIGIGHVMRMIALAQALIKSGWQVRLCYQYCPTKLVEQFEQIGATTHLLESDQCTGTALAQVAEALDASLIVIDGYQFDDSFMESLCTSQIFTMMMDDYQHCQRYHARLIVNQNIGAKDYKYNCVNPDTRLLLGTEYVLLREEFRKNQIKPKVPGKEFKILITLGGADSENISARLLSATRLALDTLVKTTNCLYQVRLVAGAANPNKTSLTAQIESYKSKHCDFAMLTDVSDMATLIASSSLVISAGGGTVWEAACLAVPNMVVILADNQRGISKFADLGAIYNLGMAKDIEPSNVAGQIVDFVQSAQFLSMPKVAQTMVDGRGATRIVQVIESI
ncbi:MAG: UDP-2,4-diacetamido-2,4,6-trideoxy-beta-L-altropyranose hydrolase [Candidatus Obscuribacter sp.]|nr:UDP-2,4-diacetamido-2,4,6-trideoxy-beta-L-altropyranose hydrolase [Candidatus Obscuribacter sp.]